MKIEVDQSGRVEFTSHNTVIAFSNHIQGSVLVTAKTKRQLQEIFRRHGQPKLFMLRTFAACIVLLIEKHINKIKQIIVDLEYCGKDRLLKDMISEMLQKKNLKMPEIYFQKIGKKSKAHYVAYGVFKNKKKANKILFLKALSELAIKSKKTEGQKT